MAMTTTTQQRPYWYYVSEWECVLCGRTEIFRERRYTPKPIGRSARYEYHETACCGHFL